MWALPRIKIRRNFLPLQAVDFIHFCRKCVNKLGECLGVCVFHLLSKSPHYPLDMRRSWISINSLRLDCLEFFNAPKVVPLWSEKQWIAIFKAPERWREVFLPWSSDIHSWNEVVQSLVQRSYRYFFKTFFSFELANLAIFGAAKTSSMMTFFGTFSLWTPTFMLSLKWINVH